MPWQDTPVALGAVLAGLSQGAFLVGGAGEALEELDTDLLELDGGVLVFGDPIEVGAPTAADHAATKDYVDDTILAALADVPTFAGGSFNLALSSQAAGDLLVAEDNNNFIRIAKGANNTVFGVDNGGVLGYLASPILTKLNLGASSTVPLYNQNSATYRDLTVGQLYKFGTVIEDGLQNAFLTAIVSSELQWWAHSGAGNFVGSDLAMTLDLSGHLTLSKGFLSYPTASTQTTVGAAGAGSALPATPDGYLKFRVNGTTKVVPFYAAS